MPDYPGISRDAFRHPLDQQAEATLRSVPGFDIVARKFVEFMYERPQFVSLMGNNVQVGPQQYASLYQMFRNCVRALDVQPEPTLFVAQNPQVNSYAIGEEHPCIVINTGLLDLLSDDEIRTVMAHELGHVKCGHTTLTQMAIWAMNTASVIGELTFGIGNVVSTGLIYAFYEWRRMAELSCDRAALLVTDNWQLVGQTMMRIAGGSNRFAHELNFAAFEQQAEAYQHLDEDGLSQVYKFLLYNGNGQGPMLSHPFPVDRLSYLKSWANSDEYHRIKAGHYQRSHTDGTVNVGATARNGEVDRLRRELADLQDELERLRHL
ncbi:M48 family metallopeptidase [Oscillatoria sp. CS-180]|uniref:M48 family metallopeptidase n=1 Tax=Oscillatoria sp. CS-180 TaxID=3021720 RepID=UPI00232F90FD|nr:M48 family metallopeptidase [Oscillatoria sp. CS-180]MDB9529253.1 M48 family metallopeptidase [Oscillatoria sp. CS-180]